MKTSNTRNLFGTGFDRLATFHTCLAALLVASVLLVSVPFLDEFGHAFLAIWEFCLWMKGETST